VVAFAPFQVVADDRRAGLKRAARVDHGRQRLVLHVDQLEGVPGGVAVLGDHERHLLALEPHLVGGQHGLRVGGQGGHPGQVPCGQGLAGDDRRHLGVRLGRDGVDGHDAGVRVRAAQHRPVQHAGQLHVVHVGALAADEPLVLLAQPPAETRRGPVRGGGHTRGSFASSGPVWPCFAAQRTERTIFSYPVHRQI
jgi:hypothetical protein